VYCRVFGALLFLTIVLASAACGRKESPAVQQLAVVRFENLSSNANLNWAGRAIATALVYDLDPAPDIHSQAVDSVSQAYVAQAARVLEGYLEERLGRLELKVVVEDLGRNKIETSYELSGPVSEGPVPLLNQLARKLSPKARPFATGNPEAFHAYGEAIGAADRLAMVNGFESATRADPRFTAAYAGWAEALLATGDREGGLAVLNRARLATQDPLDRAELDYIAAGASGDITAKIAALENLTRLTPANAKAFRELASLDVAQRKFAEGVRAYEGAARVTPDDPSVWNELGYAQAFAQNLTGARQAIERYRQMSPDDANALDSLGEVNFYLGDFAAAEKAFLDADQKHSPALGAAELAKAAQARMMTGDLAGADAIFAKYIGVAKPSQQAVAGYQQAQWEFLTGRRKQAIGRIEQVLPSLSGDTQTLAMCQLSLFKLLTGSAQEASDLADRAAASAQSAQARSLSSSFGIVFALQRSSAGASTANAYALLLAQKYQEALPALESTYQKTNPAADGQLRTLLAWAYIELGRVNEAGKLTALYPIPLSSGDPLFASLIFPRFLYLRSKALEQAGKQAEAKQNYDLYLKYSGEAKQNK
jgi:Flp pilus assembly protein TadD